MSKNLQVVNTNQDCSWKVGEFEIRCVKLGKPSFAANGNRIETGEILVYAIDLAEILHVMFDDFDSAIDFRLGPIDYFPIPAGSTSTPGFKLDELADIVDAIAEECDWTRAAELRLELMKAGVNHLLEARS